MDRSDRGSGPRKGEIPKLPQTPNFEDFRIFDQLPTKRFSTFLHMLEL